MQYHLHPDGIVYVRDGDAILYSGTRDEILADGGPDLPDLPPGMREMIYEPGSRLVFTDAKGNAWPVEGTPAPQAKALEVISRRTELKDARAARELAARQPKEGAAP